MSPTPSQTDFARRYEPLIDDAKAHGNSYFGILGGEPFLHPQLMDIFEAHPDCYFQVFTNGQLITDDSRQRGCARLGNVIAAGQRRRLRRSSATSGAAA